MHIGQRQAVLAVQAPQRAQAEALALVRRADREIADVQAFVQRADAVINEPDLMAVLLYRRANIRPRKHEVAACGFVAKGHQLEVAGQHIELGGLSRWKKSRRGSNGGAGRSGWCCMSDPVDQLANRDQWAAETLHAQPPMGVPLSARVTLRDVDLGAGQATIAQVIDDVIARAKGVYWVTLNHKQGAYVIAHFDHER